MKGFISEELTEFAQMIYQQGITDDLASQVIELLIDKIGLMLGGAYFSSSQAVYKATTQFPAPGNARVACYGDKLSPEQAAFINASFGHAQDFDDTHIQAITHPGGVVIPTAFAVANQSAATAQQILCAVAAGIEIMIRIAYSIPACHAKGFHTPTVAGPFAAAITASLLLNLNQPQCINALGIAGSYAGGLWEYTQTGGTAKRMHCAIATTAGIKAAYLAAQGVTGPHSILEGKFGVCQVFDDGSHIQRLSKELGEEFLLKGIAIKHYNCPFSIHAALEALLNICQYQKIEVDEIEKIEVGTSRFALNHVGKIRHPKNAMEAQFSMVFTLALSLLKNPPQMHDYTEENINDPKVHLLSNKIRLHEDALATREQSENMGSIVKVTTRDKRCFEKRIKYAKGTQQNRLSIAEIESKFKNCVSPVMNEKKSTLLLEKIKNFSNLTSSEELTDLWSLQGEVAKVAGGEL
ncbi:MmgE/PrpD family protein [Legionella clemsonensis]|uniref:2-methylcitrate dehydratase n=1 Tax=Legionella clemsonensis TaxID=1867846 RepID=A0A222P1B8_9GAMM|nr:MmgE/PrpD family protein [Legionella clemsonensis]ASQ45627.1 2-methylcitrate dehydratase [Legionella clemsonensis]